MSSAGKGLGLESRRRDSILPIRLVSTADLDYRSCRCRVDAALLSDIHVSINQPVRVFVREVSATDAAQENDQTQVRSSPSQQRWDWTFICIASAWQVGSVGLSCPHGYLLLDATVQCAPIRRSRGDLRRLSAAAGRRLEGCVVAFEGEAEAAGCVSIDIVDGCEKAGKGRRGGGGGDGLVSHKDRIVAWVTNQLRHKVVLPGSRIALHVPLHEAEAKKQEEEGEQEKQGRKGEGEGSYVRIVNTIPRGSIERRPIRIVQSTAVICQQSGPTGNRDRDCRSPSVPGSVTLRTKSGAAMAARMETKAGVGEAIKATPHVADAAAYGNAPAEAHLAGMHAALVSMREVAVWPLIYAKEAFHLGLQWPRGLLLHGPPGTGKTLLVHAIAQECGASIHTISAGSVFGAYAGESERKLRDTFAKAAEDAACGIPAIIFIDEIDALCPRRDGRRQQEVRVVSQLLTLMDGITSKTDGSGSNGARVLVVASTNRPNALDPALRRPGRFDREVAVDMPNLNERLEILQLHARGLPLAPGVDLCDIAAYCHGYTGADIAALCREAAMAALRIEASAANGVQTCLAGHHRGEGLCENANVLAKQASGNGQENGEWLVTMSEWKEAMKRVGPSVVRGSTSEVPEVTWEDIGGHHDVKTRLKKAVEWPIKHERAFQRLGLKPPRGVLLYGPPGCCKTTLAKAAAHAAEATLFCRSAAELFSMYVGEGEGIVRETFKRARMAAPSIIFIDDVDAIASRRAQGDGASSGRGGGGGGGGGGLSASERLLSTLLTEMDGLELAHGVLVLGATSRPQIIDSALLRPGRFDMVIYVSPLDEAGRLETLQVHTRPMSLSRDVDLNLIARSTTFFTGAEIAGLCREAAMSALREDINADAVSSRHFESALAGIQPSLSPLILSSYASFLKNVNRRN